MGQPWAALAQYKAAAATHDNAQVVERVEKLTRHSAKLRSAKQTERCLCAESLEKLGVDLDTSPEAVDGTRVTSAGGGWWHSDSTCNFHLLAVTAPNSSKDIDRESSSNNNTHNTHSTDLASSSISSTEKKEGSSSKKPTTLKGSLEMPAVLWRKLYGYQREAMEWLWTLHCGGIGGILGDDMGLGKTAQVISFLSAAMYSGKARRAIIVAPRSVLAHWAAEWERWNPAIKVVEYGGPTKRRLADLDIILGPGGGVVLTTYGMITSAPGPLGGKKPATNTTAKKAGELETSDGGKGKGSGSSANTPADVIWDYVVLDEGHTIKNPRTALSRTVRTIPSRHRLLMTGTPVQNNLAELWALFDWACSGQVLGSSRTFNEEFGEPIAASHDRNAPRYAKSRGEQLQKELRNIIDPYFLRRTKAEVFAPAQPKKAKGQGETEGEVNAVKKEGGDDGVDDLTTALEATTIRKRCSKGLKTVKHDLVVWVPPSEEQKTLYNAFLGSETVAAALNETRAPFAAILLMQQLSNSARLLAEGKAEALQEVQLGLEYSDVPPKHVPMSVLLKEAPKLALLEKLLANHAENGHRTLVFSRSKVMLDLVGAVLASLDLSWRRIDGSTESSDRQELINKYNADPSIFGFLLTTQTGGLGVTLTGADRVVIMDPSWNPSADNQAVDRAYRIGQKRDVIVYRLISCGLIEEKVYRRQVFKNSLFQSTVTDVAQARHFTGTELKQLFEVGDTQSSETARLMEDQTGTDWESEHDAGLKAHLDWLRSVDGGAFAVSNHGLAAELVEKGGARPSLSNSQETEQEEAGLKAFVAGARERLQKTRSDFEQISSPSKVSAPRKPTSKLGGRARARVGAKAGAQKQSVLSFEDVMGLGASLGAMNLSRSGPVDAASRAGGGSAHVFGCQRKIQARGGRIEKCWCRLGVSQRDYMDLVSRAQSMRQYGERDRALSLALDALALCDSEVSLHRLVQELIAERAA